MTSVPRSKQTEVQAAAIVRTENEFTVARERYLSVAEANAREVIRQYSTSFGMASKLLAQPQRQHVANVYGLVRLADEIVDGVAAGCGLSQPEILAALDALELETLQAMRMGYSTNLIVHAFARTARETHIAEDVVIPFFASMRMDTARSEHSSETFEEYVYGSAEVVGLMCLQAFLVGEQVSEQQHDQFVRGARALGSAFQKVNFLRDLAADVDGLGRQYFPGVDFDYFTEADKSLIVDDINQELAIAGEMVAQLPNGSRRAVWLAAALFSTLNRRIRAVPAETLKSRRISVPASTKLWLLFRAKFGRAR